MPREHSPASDASIIPHQWRSILDELADARHQLKERPMDAEPTPINAYLTVAARAAEQVRQLLAELSAAHEATPTAGRMALTAPAELLRRAVDAAVRGG